MFTGPAQFNLRVFQRHCAQPPTKRSGRKHVVSHHSARGGQCFGWIGPHPQPRNNARLCGGAVGAGLLHSGPGKICDIRWFVGLGDVEWQWQNFVGHEKVRYCWLLRMLMHVLVANANTCTATVANTNAFTNTTNIYSCTGIGTCCIIARKQPTAFLATPICTNAAFGTG